MDLIEEKLREFFTGITQFLNGRDRQESILRTLQSQLPEVIKKASNLTIGDGNIPFLPIIKPTDLLGFGYVKARCSMHYPGSTMSGSFEVPNDKIDTGPGIYYIYNVAYEGRKGSFDSSEVMRKIQKEARRPLTIAEAMNFCIFLKIPMWLGDSGVFPIYFHGDGFSGSKNVDEIINFKNFWVEYGIRNYRFERGVPSCDI
jgi:hypothetical protein